MADLILVLLARDLLARQTGHSHLKRKMRDDGIPASAKVIEIAARSREPISRLFDSVPHLRATPELKADVSRRREVSSDRGAVA